MEAVIDDSPWSASTQHSLYSVISAAALIVFEYLTTLDREVDFLGGRKLSWAKCIFLLNRYASIFNCLAIMVMSLPTDDPMRCTIATRLVQACNTMLLVVWVAFSGLRTHAISPTNWKTTASVLLTGLAPVAVEMFVLPQTSISLTTNSRCQQSTPGVSEATVNILMLQANANGGVPVSIVGRVCAFLSNTIVLVVTWIGTRGTIHTGKEVGLSTVFASFLFWNGVRTFAFLIIINVAQIVLSFFHFSSAMFLDLPRVLISICVSRFFSSLHRLGTHDSDQSLSLPSFSSIHVSFAQGQSIRLTE